MKNIKIFRLKIEDLRSLTSSFGNSFKFSREYAERHTSVIDDKSNLIQAINDNHAAIMRLHYLDAKMVGAVIEQLEKRYPLDFSYYQEFMDKANRVYEANSFFDSALINPFTGVSWEQFKPSPRKRKYVDDFLGMLKYFIHRQVNTILVWSSNISWRLLNCKLMMVSVNTCLL